MGADYVSSSVCGEVVFCYYPGLGGLIVSWIWIWNLDWGLRLVFIVARCEGTRCGRLDGGLGWEVLVLTVSGYACNNCADCSR